MKQIFFIMIFFTTILNAKIDVVASIVPIKTFIQNIAGNKANIHTMVKPGNSPHTYEPKPSNMLDIARSKVYFAIGIEFEKVWVDKFKNQNKNLIISHLDKGITKINNNPHIWLSLTKAKQIAKNILDTFIKIDPKNKQYYTNNYQKFIQHINNTDKKIKNILSKSPKNRAFLVFHPSWQYFAKDYNLEQIPIQINGKNPKPKQLAQIISKAKRYNIKAIFVSKEFNEKIAYQIAQTIKAKVLRVTPLDKNWPNNLILLSKGIAQ